MSTYNKITIPGIVCLLLLSGCQYFRDKDSYVEGQYKEAKATNRLVWPKDLKAAGFLGEYNIPKVGKNLIHQQNNSYPPSLKDA